MLFKSQNLVIMVHIFVQFCNDMRVSKWWQNLIFWVNIPLNEELVPGYSFLKLTFHDSVIFMSEQSCRCD